MKKIFTFLSLILFSVVVVAQSFVSTSPENKNVVLEEFTGIHCGYCPDGHVVAQGIYDQNQGDVVLINIHEGSYAAPSAGEPDFRTPFGAAIDNQAGVSGYPAGTVNRHQFSMTQGGGTAMSRGDWSSAASQILAQASYVNVAAQASIDVQTRVLTVDVEAYYTGTPATGIANSMNVVLLQNNTPGPQSGAASWNPGAIITGPWNPTYNHQHMFRHLLTGQWGEPITNTSVNTLYTNTFTYTIPADLNGVAYDLFNLEVAVFIAEGQQEIITGNMGSMTHVVAPGVNLVDLGASSNMSLPTSWCDNTINPEITVTNNSTMTVTTFEVGYSINGGASTTQIVTTPLTAGASTTISFPSTTVPAGTNNISFSVLPVSGSAYVDNAPSNNFSSTGDFSTLSPTAFATTHTEGFEGYPASTPAPAHSILENPQGNWVGVIDPGFAGGTWVGGYGTSANSYRFRFYTFSAGASARLIWEKIDFATGNYDLTFDRAHALRNSWDQDKLQIFVSTDCGTTWNLEQEWVGSALATTTAPSTAHFYPGATDWATETVDLSAYNGNPDVMIAFHGIGAGGNNLYIDNINISANIAPTVSYDCDISNGTCYDPGTGNGAYTSFIQCSMACSATDITENNQDFLIYPNPSNGIITIDFAENRKHIVTIENLIGQEVYSNVYFGSSAGNINLSKYEKGIYLITISDDIKSSTKKIIIK